MIPDDVIGNFCANRDSPALIKLLQYMDGQDNLNTFVTEQGHAENVKNIYKMLKAHSDIEQGS